MPMNDACLKKDYRFLKKEEYKDILDDNVYESLPEGQEGFLQDPLEKEFLEIKKAKNLLKSIFMKPDALQDVYLPVNIERIIKHI